MLYIQEIRTNKRNVWTGNIQISESDGCYGPRGEVKFRIFWRNNKLSAKVLEEKNSFNNWKVKWLGKTSK